MNDIDLLVDAMDDRIIVDIVSQLLLSLGIRLIVVLLELTNAVTTIDLRCNCLFCCRETKNISSVAPISSRHGMIGHLRNTVRVAIQYNLNRRLKLRYKNESVINWMLLLFNPCERGCR